MLESKAYWKFTTGPNNFVRVKDENLKLSQLTLELLAQRGITHPKDIKAFIEPKISHLHNPFQLNSMKKAINRIEQAIKQKEKVLIYGDYDADGVTATVLLLQTFQELGLNCDYYIPDRLTEGYGLNEQVIKQAYDEDISLIITVDTGISAVKEVQLAKELNIDVIITDHHEIQEDVPEVYALIHPKSSENYPFKELAGVGIAFKLAQALLGTFPEQYLDLVAIGTIADMVPLLEENRILTFYGLQALSTTHNPGIKALKSLCQIDQEVSEEQVAFSIAPRINAVGRLQSAHLAVELLMEKDEERAFELAESVDAINRQRQELVRKTVLEAEELVDEDENFIFVAKKGWHEGILGIVASRLVNKYDKPAIVLTKDLSSKEYKGSGRSIPSFNLFSSLLKIKDLFTQFGGHAQAAGLTFPQENFKSIKEELNKQVNESLSEEDFIQILEIHQQIEIDELDESLVNEINMLSPFGMGNPKPYFLLEDIPNDVRQIGQKKDHLKLMYEKTGQTVEGIGFGFGEQYSFITPKTKVKVVGELGINEWNGKRQVQIIIRDMKITERQLFDHRGRSHIDYTPFINENNKQLVISDTPVEEGSLQRLQQLDYEEALKIQEEVDDLFLMTLPKELDQLERLLRSIQPKNVHACFYVNKSAYFSPIPTRDDFKWLYILFMKRKSINLKIDLPKIQRAKNWSKDFVEFMIKVFLDLSFVYEDGGKIHIHPKPAKKDLLQSNVYQNHLTAVEIERVLYYSSYQQLRNWVMKCLSCNSSKEEIIYGL